MTSKLFTCRMETWKSPPCTWHQSLQLVKKIKIIRKYRTLGLDLKLANPFLQQKTTTPCESPPVLNCLQ